MTTLLELPAGAFNATTYEVVLHQNEVVVERPMVLSAFALVATEAEVTAGVQGLTGR